MTDTRVTATEADREVQRLRHVIDRDRYIAANALNTIRAAIAGRRWLSEPGRGSYAYDDERYQDEFGDALSEIETALVPLGKLASDKSDCTTDPTKVQEARDAARHRLAHQPASEAERVVRAYFERGFIAAAAWAMTKPEDARLSDDVIDHAWAHRDEGMDAEDMLPPLASSEREADHPAVVERAIREVHNLAVIARKSPFWNNATADQLDALEERVRTALASTGDAIGGGE